MKKAIVLSILLCALPALAEESTVLMSSDPEGKHITAVIAKDGWIIECRLLPNGKMTGIYFSTKDLMRKGDRVNISADFESAAHSLNFNYVNGYEDDYSATFWNDKAKNKQLFAVLDRLAKKLYKDYGLKKLAEEEAVRKQEEYRKFRAEEMAREAERAKTRPDPESILKKLLKSKQIP